MRKGAEFMVSNMPDKCKLSYIDEQLNMCSSEHNDCIDCPDLVICRAYYDNRCNSDEVECMVCGETVKATIICANCGADLTKQRTPKGAGKQRPK